jgi:hypothetical protein
MILNCKQCGLSKEVPDQYAGKTVKCPQCKASVKIQDKIVDDVSRYSLLDLSAVQDFGRRVFCGSNRFSVKSDLLPPPPKNH